MKTITYNELKERFETPRNLDFTDMGTNVDIENILLNHKVIEISDYSTGKIHLTKLGYNTNMNDVAKILIQYNIQLSVDSKLYEIENEN